MATEKRGALILSSVDWGEGGGAAGAGRGGYSLRGQNISGLCLDVGEKTTASHD